MMRQRLISHLFEYPIIYLKILQCRLCMVYEFVDRRARLVKKPFIARRCSPIPQWIYGEIDDDGI